jgi:hypothetical protein
MPYLQVATSNAFGLQPVENAWTPAPTALYTVSTSFGSQIFPGDVLIVTTSAGFLTLFTTGKETQVIGVAAAGCPASLTSATKIPVYNSPEQVFVALKSTAEATGAIGLYTNVLTSVSGSTTRNRSAMMIGSASAPSITTTGGCIKIVGIHPIETEDGTTGLPANRKVLVRFGIHALTGAPATT